MMHIDNIVYGIEGGVLVIIHNMCVEVWTHARGNLGYHHPCMLLTPNPVENVQPYTWGRWRKTVTRLKNYKLNVFCLPHFQSDTYMHDASLRTHGEWKSEKWLQNTRNWPVVGSKYGQQFRVYIHMYIHVSLLEQNKCSPNTHFTTCICCFFNIALRS